MKKLTLVFSTFLTLSVLAQESAPPPAKQSVQPIRFVTAAVPMKITLKMYLDEVAAKNNRAIAYQNNVKGLEERMHEYRLQVTPELFAEWYKSDNQIERSNTFSPTRTQVDGWNVGLRGQTRIGLKGELKFTTNQTELDGVSTPTYDYTNFNTTALALQLEQPLLRNAFGLATRARITMQEKKAESDLNQARYDLKKFMLGAENLYWSVSSLLQVIELQKDNVASAARTAALMKRKAGQNLVDDVEAFQTQAAQEMRELELKQSVDELNAILRQFYLMLDAQGKADQKLVLEDFQQGKLKELYESVKRKKAKREDFVAMKAAGEIAEAQGIEGVSNSYPDVSIYGTYTMNGREAQYGASYEEMQKGDFPTQVIGVRFSMPINAFLSADVREGFRRQREAGKSTAAFAEDLQSTSWQDALGKLQDSLSTFEKSQNLERLQTLVVNRERRRLSNGRTTTFQVITAEQNLATSQIQRVRSQLQLIQSYNEVKSYEVTQ